MNMKEPIYISWALEKVKKKKKRLFTPLPPQFLRDEQNKFMCFLYSD